MKKIVTLILLFISTISFGQNKEYKKAVNLFNDKKYTEANVIIEKLLNKEYGDLDEVTELYTLNMNLNCYIYTNDNKMAYSKALVYIDFIKNSNKVFIDDKSKNKAIVDTEKIVEDLKAKVPVESNFKSETNISSESNTKTKTDNSEIKEAETSNTISSDKTVTLTVSSTGKTLEEARLNALRSAIEQAFGAFISSKTEILNDNLVKDEIVSISNGNIQKYDVISQVEITNSGYAITLSATVSISKLTSFAESKGVEVEFKGGMFATNIKLQKLNEDAEIIAVSNLINTSFNLLNNSFNFNLETSDPKLQKNSTTLYDVDFIINTKKNNNYESFQKYFKETLSNLYLKKEEAENYKNLNKPIFAIIIDNKLNYLRNINSRVLLANFFINSQILTNSFKIYSNLGNIKYSYSDLYWVLQAILVGSDDGKSKDRNYPFIFDAFMIPCSIENYIEEINNPNKQPVHYCKVRIHCFSHLFWKVIEKNEIITLNKLINDKIDDYNYTEYYDTHPILLDLTFKNPKIMFTKTYELSEIEKINKFNIEKLQIEDFLKNSKDYILPEK